MNKLVIIGNGFDLAHNLPTSYKDFIDDFWKNLRNNIDDELVKKIVEIEPSKNWLHFLEDDFSNFREFQDNIARYKHNPIHPILYDYKTHTVLSKNQSARVIFRFKNKFFKEINIKSLNNWVDIENEYYLKLKSKSKEKLSSYLGSKEKAELEQTERNLREVKILNEEFSQIKKLLKNYLNKNIEGYYNLFDGKIVNYEDFKKIFEVRPRFLSKTNDYQDFLKEFPKDDYDEIIRIDNRLSEADEKGELQQLLESGQVIHQTIFLNFNYTNSVKRHLKNLTPNSLGYNLKANEINIHGKINDMNFGYGDEMDEAYKFIENLNENEFLKNFKSFKYLQNLKYKNLLDYIDSGKFQVYIMGHSCGLSDRTLLNTIFEHKHCRSIKIFYHERENGSDNFTEIIQNISRHFNDKKLMREKVVNKLLCSPLPQSIRFEKNS